MKTVNKAKLDKLIDMARAYLQRGDMENLDEQCIAIVSFARGNFPTMRILDFVTSFMGYGGLKPDATNEDIYKVLEVLGWEVEV